MNKKQKENLIKAAKAVMSNERKAYGQMRDNKGGRCCLCVMADELNLKSRLDPILPSIDEFKNTFGFDFTNQYFLIDGQSEKLQIFNDASHISVAGKSEKTHQQIGKALLEFAKQQEV